MKDTPTPLRILIILMAIPVVVIGSSFLAPSKEIPPNGVEQSSPAGKMNSYLNKTLPFSHIFRQWGVELRLSTGENRQNNIYISEYGLLRDSKEPDKEMVRQNNNKIVEIGEQLRENQEQSVIVVMVVPSASAILQHQLPKLATPVNQRIEIDNISNQLTGKATIINPYNMLLEQKDKYLYYRTEDTFTSLGGYYLYTEIMRRMLPGEEILLLDNFDVSFGNGFYGNLYERLPYDNIKKDIPMYYHNMGTFRTYHVIHKDGNDTKEYSSLYPRELEGINSFLGGGKGTTVVTSTASHDLKLLIVGDNTPLSFVPFLANHYGNITYVNILDNELDLETIDMNEFDQILFSVTAETYATRLIL